MSYCGGASLRKVRLRQILCSVSVILQCHILSCDSTSLGLSHVFTKMLCAGDDTLVRVSNDKLPGHALALSLQKVWEIIRDQKDLNLPAHKVHSPSPQAAPCLQNSSG